MRAINSAGIEWFRQVVVGTNLKADDTIDVFTTRGQD